MSWRCGRVEDLEQVFGKHNFSAAGLVSAGFLCTHGQKAVSTVIKAPVEFSHGGSSEEGELKPLTLRVTFTMEFKRV